MKYIKDHIAATKAGLEIIEYIVDTYLPEEIFPEEALERWAEDNGYTFPKVVDEYRRED